MPFFNKGKMPETEHDATITEAEVIAYVRGITDEEYKKLSKKFTLYRNLEKDLRAIDDGDIEDVVSGMLDGSEPEQEPINVK